MFPYKFNFVPQEPIKIALKSQILHYSIFLKFA